MIIDKHLGDEEAAERIMRHRARVMPAMIAMFATIHFVAAKDIASKGNIMDVSVVSWLILVIAFLSIIATGGSFVMSRPGLRKLFNDEVTRSHRSSAFNTGFWAMILVAMALLFASPWYAIPALLAIHGMIGLGITAAMARFVMLERRALKE